MKVRIDVQMGPIRGWIDDLINDIRGPVKRAFLEEMGKTGLEILREEMPEGKTGKLRAGAKYEIFLESEDRSSVGWWSDARTSDGKRLDIIVDQGPGQPDRTKASPGRYVPAIGKRLINRPKQSERGLFHGTRGTAGLIQGLRPYGPKQYISIIKEALRHFGKDYDKLMRSKRVHDTYIGNYTFKKLMKEVSRKRSYTSMVYGTTDIGLAYEYADAGPEKLRIILGIADVGTYAIDKYLAERFGPPTILELRDVVWEAKSHKALGLVEEAIGGTHSWDQDIVLGARVPKEYVHRAALGRRERKMLTSREQAAQYTEARGWEFPAESKDYMAALDIPGTERGKFMEEAGRGKYRGVGWHPGSKRTPFYSRAFRRIKQEAGRVLEAALEGVRA